MPWAPRVPGMPLLARCGGELGGGGSGQNPEAKVGEGDWRRTGSVVWGGWRKVGGWGAFCLTRDNREALVCLGRLADRETQTVRAADGLCLRCQLGFGARCLGVGGEGWNKVELCVPS